MRPLLSLALVLLAALPVRAQLDDRLRLGGSYQFYAGLRLAESPELLTVRNRAE